MQRMTDVFSLERFMALSCLPEVKVLGLELVRRGGGRHLIRDLGRAVNLQAAEADRAAKGLRALDLNSASGFDFVELPVGSPWLGMFARAQPALVEAPAAAPVDVEDPPAVTEPAPKGRAKKEPKA